MHLAKHWLSTKRIALHTSVFKPVLANSFRPQRKRFLIIQCLSFTLNRIEMASGFQTFLTLILDKVSCLIEQMNKLMTKFNISQMGVDFFQILSII